MQQRQDKLVVKKYSNRRLYDTSESRYITLEELAQRIREGREVRVVDAKTNDDLTQITLAQIILESRRAARLLPIHLLQQLIRMEDDALTEFFGRYLAWSFEVYLQAKQGAQAMSPYNPFAGLPFAASNALARMFSAGMHWRDGEKNEPPPPSPFEPEAQPEPSKDEIAELRKEIEALKQAIRK